MHVHSAAAKPRILRALPGVLSDARLASGADCATAEAAVRHHNLLCETFEDGSDAAAHHAAAVDVYLTHLESLAVPHASAHAKVAACVLFAQACLECAPRRFVASLGRWGAALGKLADGADGDGAPSPSARAALRALAAMVRRASAMMDVPGVRKESATVAQKTAAAALRWLEHSENEHENAYEPASDEPKASALLFADAPGGVVHDSIDAIAVCLESHPAALRPKVDAVETALVRVLMESPQGSSLAIARAARALARLPRAGAAAFRGASGIADPRSAFSQQMRRVLIALHDELDGGLRNMETASGDAFAKQARTALVPAGGAAPPALGGDESARRRAEKKESRAETHLDRATRLFGLLACAFRAPFPSAAGVAVPADLVLGAVRRALAADGAGVAAAPGLPATAAPAEALAALPAAHAAACDALAALLEAGGAANARLAGPVARALDGVLRAGAGGLNRGSGSDASGKPGSGDGDARPATCATTRAAAYRVAAAAARALGPASAAGELALFVVPHAASDAVFGWGSGGDARSVDANLHAGVKSKAVKSKAQSGRKKARGSGGAWGRAGADEMDAYLASGGLVDRRGGLAGGGVGSAADAVREAALDALEAIVTSGGAMLPAGVRTLADAAGAEAASRAFLAATSVGSGSGSGMLEARVPAAVRARRAAYALLLASTLAPRPFRATNLPLAASLFRAATLRDPALSNEAARAALAVEALLHPAAPPLHPRAIAPPRDFGLGIDTARGGFGDDVYGGDTLGGATWGGDARDTQRRAAPAWGDAAPAPVVSSEETEGASDDDDAAGDDAAASPSGASLPPAVAPTKRDAPERTKPAKRESSPPASPRGAKTAKRSEAEGEGVPVEGVPVEGVPEPAAPAGRASRSRAAPVAKPAPEPKPKRQTAKEKAAAAKAAAAAQAAAAASKPKSVGLGLGSGKSSVALALSDSDSDGELPEIVDE